MNRMGSMGSDVMNSESDDESDYSDMEADSPPPKASNTRRGSVIIQKFTQADADRFLKLCKLWENMASSKEKSMMAMGLNTWKQFHKREGLRLKMLEGEG